MVAAQLSEKRRAAANSMHERRRIIQQLAEEFVGEPLSGLTVEQLKVRLSKKSGASR
jgi:hypothetical protein